ncbi:hypothetical protein GDO81_013656 [Engystomops pustulosus]|uniref:PWWP domain-containing protein n=1 Tax=Engystomops pustulosus TaxID=76066 RepID=A0AAV7B3I4_ENGPU|nr:hypothetical protein GDO81_013656 [Engystomops pustulosus]
MEPRDCPEVSALSSEVKSLIHRWNSPWWPRVIRSEGSVEESWSLDADGTWMLGERVCLPRALHPTRFVNYIGDASQKRMALDMNLAEKGGVCKEVGVACCMHIPDDIPPSYLLDDLGVPRHSKPILLCGRLWRRAAARLRLASTPVVVQRVHKQLVTLPTVAFNPAIPDTASDSLVASIAKTCSRTRRLSSFDVRPT